MKYLLLFAFIILFNWGYSQTLKTSEFAGIYKYGANGEKEAVGEVIVYPESDTTILFYFEACSGPTSFSLGSIYGRLKIATDTATFFSKSYPSCKCLFEFRRDSLILTLDSDNMNCGFGHGIYMDGEFKKMSNKIISSFRDLEDKEYFFNKTKPED